MNELIKWQIIYQVLMFLLAEAFFIAVCVLLQNVIQ